MRPITYALIACLTLAVVLAGCTAPDESGNNTDEMSQDITISCPEDNSTAGSDANTTTNTTSDCPGAADNSTNTTGGV